MRRSGAAVLHVVAFGVYFAAGRLGLAVPFTSGNISPVWPASGVALALLVLWGGELWLTVAAAAFAVNVLTPIPAAAAAGLGLGNGLAALSAFAALRRLGYLRPGLSTLRDVLALVVVAAGLSTMIAATVGTSTLFLAGARPWPAFSTAWRVWWLGDAMGVLLAAPLLLTLAQWRFAVGRRWAEFAALLACAAGIALPIFGRPYTLTSVNLPALSLFPVAVWAAIRFGFPGAALINAVIAGAAIGGTAAGLGPFMRRTPAENLLLLQFFLAVTSMTSLILAAVMSERREAEREMHELSGRLLKLQDEERRRLVRELHDSTGQSLTALMMNLAAVRNHASGIGGEAKQALRRSLELAEDVVKEIRTLCCLLHPPLLDEAGLASALRWYAESLEKRGDLKIELGLPEPSMRLSQDVETALFRIAQEALTNIMRHSGSRTAAIRLEKSGGRVRLEIVDRGRGLTVQPEGVGIAGMRERVRELGGTLSIQPAHPGTAVEVVLPLEPRSPVS